VGGTASRTPCRVPSRLSATRTPDQPGHGLFGSVGGHRFGQWAQHGAGAVVQTQQQGGGHRSCLDHCADRRVHAKADQFQEPGDLRGVTGTGQADARTTRPGTALDETVSGHRSSAGRLLHHCAALTISRLQPQACGSQPGTAPARAVEESAAELAMPVGRHRAVPNPAAGARRRPPPRPGRAVGEGLLTDKGHVGGADADVDASRPRRSQHSRGRAITPADPRTGDTGRRQEARDHAAPRAPIRSGRRRSAVDAGYARL